MAESKTFCERYSQSCLQGKIYPLRSVLRHVKGSELAIPVEAVVREVHWHYLLTSLSIDNSLTKVHFASCISPHDPSDNEDFKRCKRNKCFPIPFGRSQVNILNICICLTRLLRSSQKLIVLKLENLPITCLDAKELSIGLSESSHLKLLSLAGCRLEPGALKIICDGVSRSCITWLDLSCSVEQFYEMEHVCNIIKAHSIRRGDELFPKALRFEFPNLEELHGINRISLNFNYLPLEAITTLIECLEDDVYIKALDFQKCGIDNQKAEALLHLATTHPSLEIIDLRLNEHIDESLLHRIEQQLCRNKEGKTPTCTYSPLWKTSEIIKSANLYGKGKSQKRTSKYKFQINKKTFKSFNHSTKEPPVILTEVTIMEHASVQTSDEMWNVIPENVQQLIQSLRMAVHNEKKNRHFHEARCRKLEKENAYLKKYLTKQNDDIYIDQETFLEIKNTFEKLKIFFDVMKKYGLWEYISMLGFDEYIDVIIKKNESLKCITGFKEDAPVLKDAPVSPDEIQDVKVAKVPCCDCRKMDSKHTNVKYPVQPEDTQNHVKTSLNEDKIEKMEVSAKQKVAHHLLQEFMNDYKNAAFKQMSSTVNVSQGTAKQKQSGKLIVPPSAKGASEADTLMRKFSYANMPEQVKKLVSPKEFYVILKKELERCVKEAGKPLQSSQTESSSHGAGKPLTSSQTVSSSHGSGKPVQSSQTVRSLHTSSAIPKSRVSTGKFKPNSSECINKSSHIPETKVVSREKPLPNSTKLNAVHQRKKNSSKLKLSSETSDEEIDENLTIHELLLKKNLKFPGSEYLSKAKSVSTSSSSKNSKNANHAKIKETKSLMKPEQTLPRSKLKHSSSSQTSSKCILTRSNVSSDEINSSDSIVTASDKLSTASSASSSSSSKSHMKPSLSPNESNHQKSYIESVSDASTFKDVESISDIEIAIQDLSESGEVKICSSKTKSVSSVKTSTDVSNSSQSSTLRNTLKSKQNKAGKDTKSGPSSVKNASNKSDKLTNSSTHPQTKTKTANKHGIKNRPKSNSSKGSSIPSLSDITTVSSKSVNTDSMMKQITDSEDNSKVAN